MDSRTQELVAQLQGGNDRQRRAASYKLSKYNDPSVVSILIKAYDDTDLTVKQNALSGLHNIGTKEALEFLDSHQISRQTLAPPEEYKCPECNGSQIVVKKIKTVDRATKREVNFTSLILGGGFFILSVLGLYAWLTQGLELPVFQILALSFFAIISIRELIFYFRSDKVKAAFLSCASCKHTWLQIKDNVQITDN